MSHWDQEYVNDEWTMADYYRWKQNMQDDICVSEWDRVDMSLSAFANLANRTDEPDDDTQEEAPE